MLHHPSALRPFGPSALRPRFPQLSLAPSVAHGRRCLWQAHSLDVRVLQDTINLCEIIILCAVVVIMVIIGYGLNIIPYTSWFD